MEGSICSDKTPTLDRGRLQKFSEIEGLVLSPAMKQIFEMFDRDSPTGDEQRAEIRKYYSVSVARRNELRRRV
jgi:hypothetical protein